MAVVIENLHISPTVNGPYVFSKAKSPLLILKVLPSQQAEKV